ncbi:SusC/RagA family TonB-linked outer membrane protein [Neolewinella agarilytica]|uniref:TonB-linked outer membrane protein, SusC/RagA family n=1 Tax=Neolewinella agarilytica TaxID=478744 RepID=A0A1H8Z115_9BACT|nr:TonB-dependent receptor [Neolewinella agarilytica]SEP58209.1 TonB-linked outer membrane protein, SusC/RagA family [Neolewinella agarilytica]
MKVFQHYLPNPGGTKSGRSLFVTLLLLLCTGWVAAQTVSGTVYDETGFGLVGATILVDGTTTGTVTDLDGTYSIQADANDVLIISFTGYTTQRITVGSQSKIDISLEPDVAILDQVVVTGYSQQRKGDITGAVAVLDTDELTSIAATSVNQQLSGRATGVQTSTSGAAGDGTNVRIRGISSFTSNDPLTIVDGVPQVNNFLNNINPNDIESVQILKDASAASIYGTRALNGVIIITTKTGKSGKPKITYDAYYGIQGHERGWDDILIQDPLEYANLFYDSYTNQGQLPGEATIYGQSGEPVIPQYIYVCPDCRNADGSVNRDAYSYPNNLIMEANPDGTNWWEETMSAAPITDHTLAISGGTDAGSYRISANYQDQQGTMDNTYFQRMSVRANSQWSLGKVTIGENLNISRVTSVGVPGGGQNEQGTLMQIVKAQPIIPVYDISGERFASGKTTGLSNGSNPVGQTVYNKDDVGEYDAIVGSMFAELEIIDGLNFKSLVGINYSVGGAVDWSNPTWENSEPTTVNGFSENLSRNYNWVWTNTLNYNKTFNERHNVGVLLGYESLRERGRGISGSFGQYFISDLSARYLSASLANPETRNVSSGGSEHTLLSQFGQLSYALDNKYLFTATIRRDGSSRFGPENRFGIFPAASFGWRVSDEAFMDNVNFLTDLKLRIGYGVVGNENFRNYGFVNNFGGGTGSTFYAIGGGNSLATGYTATALGDATTGWEEKTTTNVGVDATVLDGKLSVNLDVYTSTVDGLLFNPALPLTAGTPAPPFSNVGSMENNGFDLGLNWRPEIGDFKFNISANISQYTNEIVAIDGSQTEFFGRGGPGTRIGNIQINRLGESIGSFYGFQQNGIWQSQAEIDAANAIDGDASSVFQANAAPGRFRWQDIDSYDPETGELTGVPDGLINDADITIIGNPHPDLTAGLNIGVNYKAFDFTAFFFGSFGNDIFNSTKQFTIFRQFDTNADRRLVTDAWTPQNPNTDLPALDINDTESRRPSSFYVEDGSYIRLAQLQLGYTFPGTFGGDVLSNLRVYVQGQNLFTITDYSGLDPALSSFGTGNSDADDLFMGVDFGNYPTTRIFMVGVNASF